MKDKVRIIGVILILVVLLLTVSTASPSTAQKPAGSGNIEPAEATNPRTVLYQGYVTVDGTPYHDYGHFKFAIVNASGSSTYWSNDGTSANGSEPSAFITLRVVDGYFTVQLGDTSLGGMSRALYPLHFSGSGRYLRVWFSTSTSGPFTRLDLVPIAAVPYALNAETVDGYDSEALQQRVSSSCATGQAIRAINSNGTVTCQATGSSSHDHWGATWSGSGIGLNLTSTNDNSLYVKTSGSYTDTMAMIGFANTVTDYPTIGVYGESNSRQGYGVYARANGIYTNTIGVRGYVHARSGYPTFGVAGRSNSDGGAGVLAQNYWGGVGLRAQSYSGNIIEGWSGRPFEAGETRQFYVDNSGNLYATGSKSAVVETQDYGPRQLYAIESPDVWFEDVGTGQLLNGEAEVSFDPIFAQTVNLAPTYHVFLTPISDEPALLFVTHKGSNGFIVRGVKLDGQPADAAFDWRIIAKRAGYEDKRLEPADLKSTPVSKAPFPEYEPSSPLLLEQPEYSALPNPEAEGK